MRRVWSTRCGINHHFCIAVIGGDKDGATFSAHYRFDACQTSIHSFDRFYGWFDLA